MKYPTFSVDMKGTCEYCGAEDEELCVIPGYLSVCRFCFENEMTLCDVCGQLWAPDAVEFTDLPDGKIVCEYCLEEVDIDDSAQN